MVPISSRKILVHALPPLLTREEFIDQLPSAWQLQATPQTTISKNDPEREHKCKLLLYVSGHISKKQGTVDFSRAYMILETAVAVKRFCEELHGSPFTTSTPSSNPKHNATNAVVELAPVSRLPSKPIPDRVERRKRRGGRNRRNNNNSNTPTPAPQEIPLATNPFYLNFLKQEEDAKQKNDAAVKANVAKATAVAAAAVAAAATQSTPTTKNNDVRAWRRASGDKKNMAKPKVVVPLMPPTAPVPGVPLVSHLVLQIVAAREKEARERRVRQLREKRRSQNVRTVKRSGKSGTGAGSRSGKSGKSSGGSSSGGSSSGSRSSGRRDRKSKKPKERNRDRSKRGTNDAYVPPPQRSSGGGGKSGAKSGGKSGSKSGNKKKSGSRRGGSGGGNKTSSDGWTTIKK